MARKPSLEDAVTLFRDCLEFEDECCCADQTVAEGPMERKCLHCRINEFIQRHDQGWEGTNYYWSGGEHDGEHIGKLETIQEGMKKRVIFTWAADPVETLFYLHEIMNSDDIVVKGLCDIPCSPIKFTQILVICAKFDYTYIGYVFS